MRDWRRTRDLGGVRSSAKQPHSSASSARSTSDRPRGNEARWCAIRLVGRRMESERDTPEEGMRCRVVLIVARLTGRTQLDVQRVR